MQIPSLPFLASSRTTLLTTSLGMALAGHAAAAPITWSGASGVDTTAWADGTNWAGSVAPADDATTDLAIFALADFTGKQPNSGTRSVTGIQIGTGVATGALTLSGSQLTLGASGIDMKALAGASTISAPVVLGANQTWASASANNLTISGVISGTANLTRSGTGIVRFEGTASNTFTGELNISTLGGTGNIANTTTYFGKTGGALAVPANTVVTFGRGTTGQGNLVMSASDQFGSGVELKYLNANAQWARLDLRGTSQTLAGLSAGAVANTNQSGAIVQNRSVGNGTASSHGPATLTLTGSADYVFYGYARSVDGGTVGTDTLALTKTGSGKQTLVGNQITYTGATTVSGGTLAFAKTSALNTSITNNAVVEINSITGDDWILGASNTLSGAGTWRKTGAGRATFNSATLTTSGKFEIQAGSLRNNSNAGNWSGSTADMDISSGAILDLFADAIHVDELTGDGIVQNGFGNTAPNQSGASAFIEKLVVGVANGSSTFSGVIRNNAAGTAPASGTAGGGVQLEKVGTGSLTLTGTNTYTGLTSVNAGQLILDYGASTDVLAPTTPLRMQGGELVFLNLGSNSPIFPSTTVASGATNEITRGSGYISGVVDLGTLSATGGSVDVSDIAGAPGWIKASGNPSSPALLYGTVTANGGASLVGTDADGFLIQAATTNRSRGGAATGGGVLRLVGTGTGPNTPGAPVTLAAGAGTVTDVEGVLNSYTAATASPDTGIALNIGATKTLRLGAAGFVSSFAGTSLAISNGTLTAGGADNTDGVITVNAVNDISIGSTISNNGSGTVGLTKIGAGTLTLTGTHTYTGTTTLSGGTLDISGASGILPAGAPVHFKGGSLSIGSQSPTLALSVADGISATISGAGVVLQGDADLKIGGSGAGNQALDLSGLSSFTYNAPTRLLQVGPSVAGVTAANKSGTLTLPPSATITTATINVGGEDGNEHSADQAQPNAQLYMGASTILNVDNLRVGQEGGVRSTLAFKSGTANPVLTIRGAAGGSSRANISVGKAHDVYTVPFSTIDLVTGVTGTSTLDAMVNTLDVHFGTTGNNSGSTFLMGAGTLDATTLRLANVYAGTHNNTITGTFTTGGGTVKASSLVFTNDAGGNGQATGVFNLNSGSTLRAASVTPGNGAGKTLNWNDGTIANYDGSTDLTIASGITIALATAGTHAFNIETGRTGSVASVLSNAAAATGTLAKTGAGILTLTGASTYSGTTTVDGGTLRASNATGSATGTGAVSINTTATFGGTGAVSGAVTVNSGGTLAPGTSIESLATGELTLAAGSTFAVEYSSSGAPTTDVANVTGNVTLAGSLSLTDLAAVPIGITLGNKLTIITYSGTLTGTFAGLPEGATVTSGANAFIVRYADGNAVTLESTNAVANPYDSWASSKGLTALNKGSAVDADFDGASNLLEYYLDGNPLTSDSSILPAVTRDATHLILTFKRRDDARADVSAQVVEYGTNLTAWPLSAVLGTAPGTTTDGNGVIVTVAENGSNPDDITVKIPRTPHGAGGKLFARLKVTE
ncbi:autotransporter-associated beta strand repeat-containing protein [Luteolibacter arcticus]|uniref:Autotransporter-associated beta strand repeat-containing protein n=1 Tax=Luteolibacter arcticus TaxID=1581411 RepID=A0ABT3GS81_9BACT|nr:autotransporter-associated beta strand repeat-containing protein [Luteolibacter arcticus]MCW1926380.1 autotransporter-associated beta strand repeat-containing protein [Luteolibacter arcticus]